MSHESNQRITRRRWLGTTATGAVLAAGSEWASPLKRFAIAKSAGDRPLLPGGVASGDVAGRSAVIWSQCDRPAQMVVEWSTTESFAETRGVTGPIVLEDSALTGKLQLTGLPPGERIFYRVRFQDLRSPRNFSEPVVGTFRTPPAQPRDVRFIWSGDTVGQGYGINTEWGGLKIYDTMRSREPDFFLHSGDYIYADNPIPAEIKLPGGGIWRNLVTPAKSKVAETLDEFRGNYAYNLLDEHYRAFNASVSQYIQWDDHETLNNWYPGEMLAGDRRYTEQNVSLLAARGRRAFFEFTPTSEDLRRPGRIYRSFAYGPQLELFILDARSYRGPNNENRQTEPSADTAFFGREQLQWLKQRLRRSQALWKVIACDMPLGLVVSDGGGTFENIANGKGPPLGRELELAELLGFLKQHRIENTVWLTADVHYAAAHYYDPQAATGADFLPFWEFVAGPLHAGSFGPNPLDPTFGPQVKYQSVGSGMPALRGPADGALSFGQVQLHSATGRLTVSLHNLAGEQLHTLDLEPKSA